MTSAEILETVALGIYENSSLLMILDSLGWILMEGSVVLGSMDLVKKMHEGRIN